TTTRSADSGGAAVAPAARNSSSKPSESAWLTRHPKVITEYFIYQVQNCRIARCRNSDLRLKRFSADVAPVLHPVEINRHDAGVRACHRFVEPRPASDDGEHAAACGHHMSIARGRTRVIDRDAGD